MWNIYGNKAAASFNWPERLRGEVGGWPSCGMTMKHGGSECGPALQVIFRRSSIKFVMVHPLLKKSFNAMLSAQEYNQSSLPKKAISFHTSFWIVFNLQHPQTWSNYTVFLECSVSTKKQFNKPHIQQTFIEFNFKGRKLFGCLTRNLSRCEGWLSMRTLKICIIMVFCVSKVVLWDANWKHQSIFQAESKGHAYWTLQLPNNNSWMFSHPQHWDWNVPYVLFIAHVNLMTFKVKEQLHFTDHCTIKNNGMRNLWNELWILGCTEG